MAEEKRELLPVESKYSTEMYELLTEDPAHADLFNVRYQQLLNNCLYLKNEKSKSVVFQTTEELNAWISSAEHKGLLSIGDSLFDAEKGNTYVVTDVLQEVSESGTYYTIKQSGGGGTVIGTAPPDDVDKLWIDIGTGGVLKYYDAAKEEWTAVAAVWG